MELSIIAGVLALAAIVLGVVAHVRHRRIAHRVRTLRDDLRQTHGELVTARRELYAWRAAMAIREPSSHSMAHAPFLRSQFGEDAFLLDLFAFAPRGFFIEAGAYDGVRLSATKVFEDMGWSGLLVEPLPERFEQCRQNRPRSRVVRAALGGPGAKGSTSFQVAHAQDSAGGAASIVDMASQRQAAAHQRDWVEKNKGSFRTIEVPLTSLAALLVDHLPPGESTLGESALGESAPGQATPGESTPGESVAGESGPRQAPSIAHRPVAPRSIDLLVLDVEGDEAKALRGLDLQINRPRVVVIEDLTRGSDASAASLLEESGYIECVRFGHNRVFILREDSSLTARAARLLEETLIAAPGFWERVPA
ncbi:MAG: FkbM family methyltransferase [Planctomycetota bacterium]|nr:FkbM family methyltransferase [Planctomycetota bacterium]